MKGSSQDAGRRCRTVLERGIERGDLRSRPRHRPRARRARRAALLPAADHRRPDRRTARRGRRRADPARLRADRRTLLETKEGSKMKIHAIQTGTVAITTKWREGVGPWPAAGSCNTLLDREWTEPLPIYAFAIEHPEGVIVVDTGETARASQPGYFPRWQPFFRFAVREQVRARAGDRPSARAARHLPSRCPPGRDDPSAHRPRRRPAPLPRHRDPRRDGRARLRSGTARARFAATRTRAGRPGFDPTLIDLPSRSRSARSRRACR